MAVPITTPLPRTSRARRPPGRLAAAYCRLTWGFVIGFYLPWAAAAPDLLRHFGEAVHTWAILFFAPIAAWRLLAGSRAPKDATGGAPE